MKIAVFIKQVPAEGTLRTTAENTLVRDGIVTIINPADLTAVEEALQIKDRTGASITAISMGPLSAESILRQTAAMGVDQIYLISDRLLAGSDTYATAKVLSSAVRCLGGFDLLLCGRRSIDGETGQVGPELAALLDIPCVTNCTAIHLEEKMVTCRRMVETEYQEWRMPMPALLTVYFGINAPRLSSIAGLRRAKTLAMERLTTVDLGLLPADCGLTGSPTRVQRITIRPFEKRQAVRAVGVEGVDPVLAMIAEAKIGG